MLFNTWEQQHKLQINNKTQMVGSQSGRGGQESGLQENDLSTDRAPSRGVAASSPTSRLFILEGLTVGFWNPYL